MSELDKAERFLALYRTVKMAEIERWQSRVSDDAVPCIMAPDEAVVAAVRYALEAPPLRQLADLKDDDAKPVFNVAWAARVSP